MAEKPTQSTAGNNILSQTEYDAVLSHMEVISAAATQPNAYAVAYRDMRHLLGEAPGAPMRRKDIDIWLTQIRGIALASPQAHSITRTREIAQAERAKRAIVSLLSAKR